MLLEVYDITPLRNFFDVVYNTTDIVEMKLDASKLSISLLNKSHVAFYSLEIQKDFFGDYEVTDGESVLIFVEDFYKILKSAHKDDILYLESNDSYLVCKFEHDGSRRVFELPLADDESSSATPPSIDYDGIFDVSIDDLKQPCNDLDKIVKTDKFKIITNNQLMSVVAPADSMTQYNQIIRINDDCQCNVTVNTSYVQDILKLSKISKVVTLYMGDNLPLSWNIESPDKYVKVSGLIAPIIEQED